MERSSNSDASVFQNFNRCQMNINRLDMRCNGKELSTRTGAEKVILVKKNEMSITEVWSSVMMGETN